MADKLQYAIATGSGQMAFWSVVKSAWVLAPDRAITTFTSRRLADDFIRSQRVAPRSPMASAFMSRAPMGLPYRG